MHQWYDRIASPYDNNEKRGLRAVNERSEVLKNMARPEGFEPPTYGFVVRRSIR